MFPEKDSKIDFWARYGKHFCTEPLNYVYIIKVFLLQSSSLITLICFLTIYHSCERQFQTKDIFYLLSCWRKLKRHNIFWLRSSLIRILLSVTSGHTMPEQIIMVCGTEIEVNILTFVSIFVLVCLPASKLAIVTAAHEKHL